MHAPPISPNSAVPSDPESDPDPSDALDDAGMPPWLLLLLLLVLQMLPDQTPREHCSTEEFALLQCTVMCTCLDTVDICLVNS